MRFCVLVSLLLLSSAICAGTYEITFMAEKKVLSRPSLKRKVDKKHNIILKNKLMTKLYIQLLNQKMELVQSISLGPGKEKSIVFNNTDSLSYLRPLQPASKLIILDYSKNEGGEIEVP